VHWKVTQHQWIGVPGNQHGQVEITVLPCGALNLAAEGVDGHGIGQLRPNG